MPSFAVEIDKLITRGSLVAALLSAMGYLSFAFLLDCPADTPYIHLYLTAAYFCVGAATVGSYFACLTTGKLTGASSTRRTSLLSSIAIIPCLSHFITLRPPLSARSIFAGLVLLLDPLNISHGNPRTRRSKVHNLPRSDMPSSKSIRSIIHASRSTSLNPST